MHVDPKDAELGVYEKFRVERTDGRSAPGEKHHGCTYFVLDVDHDPYAIPALKAYAEACRATFPKLSADVMKMRNGHLRFGEAAPGLESIPRADGSGDAPRPGAREVDELDMEIRWEVLHRWRIAVDSEDAKAVNAAIPAVVQEFTRIAALLSVLAVSPDAGAAPEEVALLIHAKATGEWGPLLEWAHRQVQSNAGAAGGEQEDRRQTFLTAWLLGIAEEENLTPVARQGLRHLAAALDGLPVSVSKLLAEQAISREFAACEECQHPESCASGTLQCVMPYVIAALRSPRGEGPA